MNTGFQALSALPTGELWFLLGVPVYFLIGLAYFTIRARLRGVPRSARFEKVGDTKVVPRFFLEYGYFMLHSQVKLFLALRISADMMTVFSLIFASAGAALI